MISFDKAYRLTLEHIQPLPAEEVPLLQAEGRIAAQALKSLVDSPTADTSMKDGYAVRSADIQLISDSQPARLRLVGSVSAGGDIHRPLEAGEAVRMLTGGRLPQGADTVVAEEYTQLQGDQVLITATADAGRNVLFKGSDVHTGQLLLPAGQPLAPTMLGLLAAGGLTHVPVVQHPRVAIIATGDEVIAPGKPLPEGKLYASNLVTLACWCLHYDFVPETTIAPDDEEAITDALHQALESHDAIITSGGAWKGERDLVVHILDRLGWQKLYHRIKMGPGKAVGFGLLQGKPVFILPGGPPSNHMAFLQLVIPGLHRMAGWQSPGFPLVQARLLETLRGQSDWTQFIHGQLSLDDAGAYQFCPSDHPSRLQMLANTNGVARIPEGLEILQEGDTIPVQNLL